MEELEGHETSEDESINYSIASGVIESSLIYKEEDDDDDSSDIIEKSLRTNLPLISDSETSGTSNSDAIEVSSGESECEETSSLQDITTNIENPETSHLLKQIDVSPNTYRHKKEHVANLQHWKNQTEKLYNNNKDKLPDKGEMLQIRYKKLEKDLQEAQEMLDNMTVTKEPSVEKIKTSWETLQAGLSAVQPRTFGQQAMNTLNMQKALTVDRLEQLHGSLNTCPTEDIHEEDPKGLKVELMPHQTHALAWLLWREKQKPSGGILADDMGLGKTLTMISLILKCNQIKENADGESDEETTSNKRIPKHKGGTLVVCPASLVHQWEMEIKNHVKKFLLTIDLYHGSTRETNSKRLAKYDIVITTYSLVLGDYNKTGPLFGIKWGRVILDEAHQIRNHKAQSSIAVCHLSAISRWALTGTPVHNKELDLYSLLKFLRCTPFDDLAVWKRWVANKTTGGQDRLNTVLSSLILRRTKQQLEEKKLLTCLPEKTWNLIKVKLDEPEMEIYQKFLIFSRTLFAQYLQQRAEKENDNLKHLSDKPEYFKMYQSLASKYKVKTIKQHEILVLLLRLRQICCHPHLLVNMLEHGENEDDIEQDTDELNILEQLKSLNINDNEPKNDVAAGVGNLEGSVGLREACKNILNPKNAVFAANRQSSKIKIIMNLVKEILPTGEKIILVSQWTKLLHLIGNQLKESNIKFYQLDGSIPVHKRMEIVQGINDPSGSIKILLLSLTAGGVGLNLIGANNLILVDLHWNPQLEMQAQDRIYRVGQKKSVKMYKLMTVDTIEERIKGLQERKMNIATELLTGAKIQQTKLSFEDLKMLFSM